MLLAPLADTAKGPSETSGNIVLVTVVLGSPLGSPSGRIHDVGEPLPEIRAETTLVLGSFHIHKVQKVAEESVTSRRLF